MSILYTVVVAQATTKSMNKKVEYLDMMKIEFVTQVQTTFLELLYSFIYMRQTHMSASVRQSTNVLFYLSGVWTEMK